MHTSEYSYSCIAEGQNAIVIGAGCSGHDIAQDLATKGSKVTLVQRSPTAVVSREAMGRSFRGTPLSFTNQHTIDLCIGRILCAGHPSNRHRRPFVYFSPI